MEELTYIKNYQEYKAELGNELTKAAESFVRIGYLLKVARDTNILHESGYATVTEFAKAEFGIDKTQVSRFISINDKFAEGGYSERLKEEFRGFGYAKLTIMLQLPDTINEELTPNYSKSEIQAIKDEIDEEQKVSDIERVIEVPNPIENNLEEIDEHKVPLFKTILQLGEDDPELYIKISEQRNEDLETILPETMAPSGDKTYSIRVMGIGRLMLMISDMSEYVKLVNSRSGEKLKYTWPEVAEAWIYAGVLESATPIECWERRYEKKCPVAPVQPPNPEKTGKKETKVSKAPKKDIHKTTQKAVDKSIESTQNVEKTESESNSEIQCEGQTSVEDFPEMMPNADANSTEIEVESTVSEKNVQESDNAVQEDAKKPFGTRKDYIDTLTAYGAAEYIAKEHKERRLLDFYLTYCQELEKWLSEKVDAYGNPWEGDE